MGGDSAPVPPPTVTAGDYIPTYRPRRRMWVPWVLMAEGIRRAMGL